MVNHDFLITKKAISRVIEDMQLINFNIFESVLTIDQAITCFEDIFNIDKNPIVVELDPENIIFIKKRSTKYEFRIQGDYVINYIGIKLLRELSKKYNCKLDSEGINEPYYPDLNKYNTLTEYLMMGRNDSFRNRRLVKKAVKKANKNIEKHTKGITTKLFK